jgi:hypothetical protein
MSAALSPLRDRAAATPRPAATAARPAPAAASDLSPDEQHALAAQHQAFDFQLAEDAELQREREALDALLTEHLKNEDDIMKKWIAMI